MYTYLHLEDPFLLGFQSEGEYQPPSGTTRAEYLGLRPNTGRKHSGRSLEIPAEYLNSPVS